MQPITAKASGMAMRLVMGEDPIYGLWTTLIRRIAFAFGLVIGIAILGALAFTVRTDVRVLWFDERGYPIIGLLRTETQERLEQALRDLARATHLREDFEDHTKTIGFFRQQNAELRKRLEERDSTHLESRTLKEALTDKDRQIERLNTQLQTAPKLNEYRAALVGGQLYLPLRERPEAASRTLKSIPANAAGVLSICKLAVYENAVLLKRPIRA